jgi:hypothetical protein
MSQAKETSGSDDTRELVSTVIGAGGVLVAALVVIWQAYVWLKTGQWPQLTLVTLTGPFISGSVFAKWLVAPHSWYGLHAVVKSLYFGCPLWVWIVFASTAISTLVKY